MTKIIELYNRGIITEHEMHSRLLDSLRHETLDEFRSTVPAQTVEYLRTKVSQYPTDDEGWSKMRVLFFGIRTCTPEEAKEHDRRSIEMLRKGVEIFREENL